MNNTDISKENIIENNTANIINNDVDNNIINKKSYHDNGALKSMFQAKEDGTLEGDFIEYYENGQKRQKLKFINSKLNGVCRFFSEEGMLEQVATFKEGELHGRVMCYIDDEPFSLANYIQGKIHGTLYSFKNRKVQTIVEYKNNKQHGLAEYFDNKQNKIREEKYKNGKLDGEIISFHPNGLIIAKQYFAEGKEIE